MTSARKAEVDAQGTQKKRFWGWFWICLVCVRRGRWLDEKKWWKVLGCVK